MRASDPPEPTLNEKVAALRRPSIYRSASRVETIETHFAWVFMVDDCAYKLKKPLQADRMDHRILSARHRSCLEELRLNRRLAADIYLDVIALRLDERGAYHLGNEPGEAIEWLVKMRRLRAHDMLNNAIAAKSVTTTAIDEVAKMLAEFYARQAAVSIQEQEYAKRIESQVAEDRVELLASDLRLPSELAESVIAAQLRFIRDHASLLHERARNKKFIEAHGDLRPEHVYCGMPPCVIDCLEFDRGLRLCDPVEELAFFYMECAHLDAEWIGKQVMEKYRVINQDVFDRPLLYFYLSRRAAHRALIVAWHLRDSNVRGMADWRAIAIDYLQMAQRYGLEDRTQ